MYRFMFINFFQVVYLEAFYRTLYAIIASFSCLILLMIVLDKHQNKVKGLKKIIHSYLYL